MPTEKRRQSAIEMASLGARQAICRHALAATQRMIREGVPDAAAVGIALEHLQHLLDDRVAAIGTARERFTEGDQ